MLPYSDVEVLDQDEFEQLERCILAARLRSETTTLQHGSFAEQHALHSKAADHLPGDGPAKRVCTHAVLASRLSAAQRQAASPAARQSECGAAGAVDWMDGVEHHQTCTAEPLQQHTAGTSTRRRLPSTLLSKERGCKTSSTCPPSSQAASGSLASGAGRSLHGTTGHARPYSHTPLSAPHSLPLLVFQGGTTYASTPDELVWYLGQLLLARPQVVGFDMEWTPTFVLGEKQRKTALMQLCYCLKRSAPVPASDASKPSSLPSGSASSMGHSGVAIQEQEQGMATQEQQQGVPLHPEASAGRALVISQEPGPAVGTPFAPVSLTSGCTHAASPSTGAGSTTGCEQPPCSDAVAVPLASTEELAAASIPVPRSFTRVPCAEYPPPPTMDLERGTDCVCLLLHVAHTGVPPLLVKLLQSSAICKAGVNITGDAQKLRSDFGICLGGMLELSDLGNKRQLAHMELVTTHEDSRKWSLAGLVEAVLHHTLPKPKDVRLGDWDTWPLNPIQQRYAAMDAFASLAAYGALAALPPREKLRVPPAPMTQSSTPLEPCTPLEKQAANSTCKAAQPEGMVG